MNPKGRESDPMAPMRPRGDPTKNPSPHAYFHQVFFREGGTLLDPSHSWPSRDLETGLPLSPRSHARISLRSLSAFMFRPPGTP